MMIINYPKCLDLSKRMAKLLRKSKRIPDWILYCNTERDPIPAAIFSTCFPGSLVAPASPGLMSTLPLQRSVLFSVIADKVMFDIWEGVLTLFGKPLTSVAFFKTLDDPNFWLEIAIREEVRFEW